MLSVLLSAAALLLALLVGAALDCSPVRHMDGRTPGRHLY